MIRVTCLSALFCTLSAAVAAAQQPAQPPLDFNRDIKPILSNNCYQCHGPDADERKGGSDGLRLDTREGALVDLGSGSFAVVPGKPEKSQLLARMRSADPDEQMPPPKLGKKISPRDIQLLERWIKEGAKYAQHWSYVKPVRPAAPAVKQQGWARSDIDRFLLARLEQEQLKPQPEADRYTLIRRLALDLTGLPPSLDEVDQFVADKSPDAYEKLVDRLLTKETYGEHWAHMWLDLARYADSAGYADDPPRKIWMFRDYVIKSLNANKPFDQFTLEQIAGDLLPSPTPDQLIATAFHRNTLTNNEGGTNDEEFRNVAIVDRVNTTMAVWMGTTIHCAQCHTHKYDPLSQEEFFQLFAIFNNTEDADRGDESPLFSLYTPAQEQQKTEWQGELAKLKPQLKTLTPELKAAEEKWAAAFPLDLKWQTLTPASAAAQSGGMGEVAADQSVKFAKPAAKDVYTLDLPLPAGGLQALRLETLPDDALPGKGAGHGGGNFVLSGVKAVIKPPAGAALAGRYVRIDLPGKGKMLSLAEVQVFQGAANVAPRGEAKQSSTAYEGPAKLAIDGNTSGNYNDKSVTHTNGEDNPWWELDLKNDERIDRVVLWNRTDGGLGDRLKDFKISVLNAKHEPVWEQNVAPAPNPSAELSPTGERTVEFAVALADYSQPDFVAANVLKNPDAKTKGWAVGGQVDKPHVLTLIAKAAAPAPAGARLLLTLEQNTNHANHVLGKFRLSATDDARAAQWAGTPAAVIEALRSPANGRPAPQQQAIDDHFVSIAPELADVRKKVADLEKQLTDLKPETVPVQRELGDGKRRKTRVQIRGNFLDLGKEVSEGTPAIFPPLPAGQSKNRLALAKWLVDEQNPLTARVIANRYWEQIFGIGIVATSEEFGSQGEQPFHPELLDWLATELIRLKWDSKAFIKLLVTSAAYRQSSKVSPDLYGRDPENRLLARGPRVRLSAEMIRDQALTAAGLLSGKMYGAPVKPPQPSMGLSAAFGGGIDWKTSDGEDKYRRGLYTTWRRSNPYPSMATFDAPNREVCTVRRVRTNTPLQALVTLNDPVYVEASQALARRMLTAGGATPAERAAYGFRLCLSRPPQAAETSRLVQLYEQSLAKFRQDEKEAVKMATDPLGPAKDLPVTELAAWTVVANVLLNLDEALMKR